MSSFLDQFTEEEEVDDCEDCEASHGSLVWGNEGELPSRFRCYKGHETELTIRD